LSAGSDDLYTGPTLLAPGASDRGRKVAGRLLIPLVVLFVVIILLFYVFFTAFTVRGESMEPTLRDRDRLLVTKSYEEPARGDIVVFRALDMQNREEELVKRVIAIPGDTVEVRAGVAIVNGVVQPTSGLNTSPYDGSYTPPTIIKSGHIFVLGDNRPIAFDSRQLGPVPIFSVEGKAVYRFAPLSRMRSLR